MSTKSSLLSPKRSSSFKPLSVTAKVMLGSVSDSKHLISIRRLSLTNDISLLYKWMHEEDPVPGEFGETDLPLLKEAYASILASDFSWPYIGSVNTIPICQLELCKAAQDAVSLCYEARKGDYGLHMVADPRANAEQVARLLSGCVDYFLSFSDINRLIAYPETGDLAMKTLLKKLGFKYQKKICILPFKIADLYIHTKKAPANRD